MIYTCNSELQTLEIGKTLGKKLSGGSIVTLSGDLGAGKTVFTKGIALGLGITDTVVSPTFNLMNEYRGTELTLYHYDAYRLSGAREAYESGLVEYFGDECGVCVIEWWQNIAEALTGFNVTAVNITYKDENSRVIEIVEQ